VAQKIRVVVATRETRERFFTATATGRSLALYKWPFAELVLFDENRLGLPVIYNRAIEVAREDPAILVFIHDDVHLCDFFWPWHIVEALAAFQLVGLVGVTRRVPNQPTWRMLDTDWTPVPDEDLSGVIAHGSGYPPEKLSVYGQPYREVALLDGVMLACASQTLLDADLRFDEAFEFHHYDMDFCRQAEIKRIKMGTWSIAAVHESKGGFQSVGWQRSYERYIEKWGS
jgi:hypothetical protein